MSSMSCERVARDKANRPLAVIVSCDTAGWIVPCGCSSKQAGGLLRRATFVHDVGRSADVVVADAGGAPGGSSPYDRAKFEAVLRGELQMDVAAHNLGGPEAELGADYLRSLAPELHRLLISTNLHDALGKEIAATHRIVTAGSKRVAVLGVLSPRYATEKIQIAEPHEAVLRLVPALKGQYDVLLVLAYLPEDELEAFVARVPEADLVVGGPTGQSIAPRRTGPTVWAAATNKGKFLIQLDRPVAARAAWEGRIVELGTELNDDPDQMSNLQRFREQLARVDFPADQTGFRPALPAAIPADFRVAGTDACRTCHSSECDQWEKSSHANAWQTLVDKNSHADPYCQHCHTTGYGLPGGFTSLASGGERTNVGCESCHGPSGAHLLNPRTKTSYDARDRCLQCHDRENSPQFEYDKYWNEIVHGGPSRSVGEK
jgi:nitrate reductase cytochrome c-type subunit